MAMIQEFPDLTIPLERNQQGVIRVAGTRVSLDSILHAYYREGATAEEIVLRFPTCKLEDVYTVISRALHHPEFVSSYLAEQADRRNELEREIERESPQAGLRERLLARSRQT
jgi:uncharacterized protein (DUF433 family)